MVLCLWCYHDTFKGALFVDDKVGKYIDLAYNKIMPIAGKILGPLGIPQRDAVSTEKKEQ